MLKLKTGDNFAWWFGKSKMVYAATGRPIIFYHRSRSKEKFSEFKYEGKEVEKNLYNTHYGFFFVDENKKKSIDYIANGVEVYAYLRIENPFYIYDDGKGGIVDMKGVKYDALNIDKKMVDNIVNCGYDGIVIDCHNFYSQFIVFDPSQIKSIDNDGEYSRQTNNIYK